MSKLLLDFSAGLPTATSIKTAGYGGVISYVRKENPASGVAYMTAPYYQSLIAAGLTVNFVYENYDRLAPSYSGYNGGVHDATWAINDLASRNIQPRNIFMAHDIWETLSSGQIQSCRDYQRGARDVLGDIAGAYAFAYLLQKFIADGTANFTWLTGSASSKFAGLNVYQRNYGQQVVGGIQCDVSEVLTLDGGQLPDPNPTPPPPDPQEQDMVIVHRQTPDLYILLGAAGQPVLLKHGDPSVGSLTAIGIKSVVIDDDTYAALRAAALQ